VKMRSRNGTGFVDRHLATVITVVILLGGQIASFAVLQSRVNYLEDQTKDVVRRSEHTEITRRVEALETQLVPRSEHLLRDTELNKRLDQIQDSIKEVRDRVEIIDSRQRNEHR